MMKSLAVIVLLAIATQSTHAANINCLKGDPTCAFILSVVEEKLRSFLESLKENMKTGDEAKGIPKIDPFYLKHQQINVVDSLFIANGEIDDLNVEGLSDFNINDANFLFGTKKLSIDFTWPSIKGKTLYSIQAKIMDYIPVSGQGDAIFEAHNFNFKTNAMLKLDLKNKKITIKEFKNTKISLEKFKLIATGLYNDEELSEFMSGLISDILPQGLDNFQNEVTTRVNELLLKVGNEFLENANMEGIWSIIVPGH